MPKMDKENGDKHDGDKKNSSKSSSSMNGGGGGGGGGVGGGGMGGMPDPSSLLDASNLFAYWGRDPAAAAAAAAANSLFGAHFGGGNLGMLPSPNAQGNDRYSMQHAHHNTMAVAASQAASLAGLHTASWWPMAQIAAQDYFSRLQASGLPSFGHPDLAAAFAAGQHNLGGLGAAGGGGGGGGGNSSGNSTNHGKSNSKSKKKDKSNNNNNYNSNNSSRSGNGVINSNNNNSYNKNSSPSQSSSSSSAYKQQQSSYNPSNLHKELLAMSAAAAAVAAQKPNSPATNKKSSNNSGHDMRGSPSVSMSKSHHSSPNMSGSASQQSNAMSQSLSSNQKYGNNNSGGGGGGGGGNSSRSKDYNSSNNVNDLSNNTSITMSALNSLSQFGNLDLTSHQSVTAAMNALAASSNQNKDYMSSGILNAALEGSDPSSLLGVRLPPDTEIIKYTSSIVGPKVPGTTNRGRKKTISLDPNPFFAGLHNLGLSAAKRARYDTDFSNLQNAHQNDRVEVIKLPPTITTNGSFNLSKSANKEQADQNNEWGGLKLIAKSNNVNDSASDGDAPLNLSTKSDSKSKNETGNSDSNSLQSLSSITAALGSGERERERESKSRRTSDSKSRRTETPSSSTGSANNVGYNSSLSELLKISNYEENEYNSSGSNTQYKEGRPRNLGRGVSKPKKNTVASLLAQSRAVSSIKPLTPQQYLNQEADLEKLRQAIEASQAMDTSNTDTESLSESVLSESEGEEQINLAELRIPLDKGWKRETIIHGLTKTGQIKGDVYYIDPYSQTKLKNYNQIQSVLDQKHSNLTKDNFSFSAKAIVGTFLQSAPPPYATDGEYIRMSDVDVAKRLEELKMFTRQPQLAVEQRIEIARHQQAMREAKKYVKDEIARNKEKAKQAKEIERTERLEQQRKERELKNQQALEARRKREEELNKQKMEENLRKQQEKELKRQQAILLKEQELNKQKEYLYQVELERERRRQHMTLIRQLEMRRKFEEREKKKHQIVLEKLICREKRLANRKRDVELLNELRKPQEDTDIPDKEEMPELSRISGAQLTGQGLADLFMVFEFLHNFGETLGFDMESLPSLDSLHQALVSENATEAEDELLSVMTHLLVCAIEDPGIPNPGRHTTLLGQTLRQADITHSNVSEILRIYLYAVATGEIKQMNGVNFERDRDRKVADHHISDADVDTTGKNSQFYECLHETNRWKLCECLKDKPFVSLNPPVKAELLAMLCNDLLINKAVCKQIDGSIESQALLKKERYVIDAKIRKIRSLVTRKVRMEQYEKAQALALEKSLSIKAIEVEEAKAAEAENNASEVIEITDVSDSNEAPSEQAAPAPPAPAVAEPVESTNTTEEAEPAETPAATVESVETADITEPIVSDAAPPAEPTEPTVPVEESTAAPVTLPEVVPIAEPPLETSSPVKEKEPALINGTSKKDTECNSSETESVHNTTNNNTTATDINLLINKSIINDVTTEKIEEDNSDLESEGTQLEEDEDASLTADEAKKKLEKMLEASAQNKFQLQSALNQLRSKCYGQDRFWRRYWHLPKTGGMFVEAMESAQPDLCAFMNKLEEQYSKSLETETSSDTPPPSPLLMSTTPPPQTPPPIEEEVKKEEEADDNQSNSDSEMNEEATADEKMEVAEEEEEEEQEQEQEQQTENKEENEIENDNVAEEKEKVDEGEDLTKQEYNTISIDPFNNKTNQDDMLDIEESIPTAILVQQKDTETEESTVIEVNNQPGVNVPEMVAQIEDLNNKLEEIQEVEKKNIEESEIIDLVKSEDSAEENAPDEPIKAEIKEEPMETDEKPEIVVIKSESNSVVDATEIKEDIEMKPLIDKWFSIVNREMPLTTPECPVLYSSQIANCNMICRDPLQFQGHRWDISNNMQHFSVPFENRNDIHFLHESALSLSGLDENVIDKVVRGLTEEKCVIKDEPNFEDEDILQKEMDIGLDLDLKGSDIKTEEGGNHNFTLPPYINLSLNNLTAYIQCDVGTPLQMTLEEQKQLENVKNNGLPKKDEKAFVPKKLRYGWWKINTEDELNKLINSLNVRGIREKNLRQNITLSLTESMDLSTPHVITEVEEEEANVPAKCEGCDYIDPDAMVSWNPQIARRVEVSLLEQVEAMEDKIASASMQVKGWVLPQRDIELEVLLETGGIPLIRDRIIGLEAAIERRYLKPPLGTNTTEAQIAAIAQQESQHTVQISSSASSTSSASSSNENELITKGRKGLVSWREAVGRSVTCAQLSMALYVLESCVAWDKSIMKAPNKRKRAANTQRSLQNCQFCQSGESEDKLLLCDGCDRGYHTYCFKPRMEKIPEGDWYCFECVNKATNERKCIVCGGHRPQPVGKMILCELCPRAYHHDCYIPPMLKIPRGKWYCQNCVSKAPPRKRGPRKPREPKANVSTQSVNTSQEEAPLSPTHSASSSTFEDPQTPHCNNESKVIPNTSTPIEMNNKMSSPPPPVLPPPPVVQNNDVFDSSMESLNNSSVIQKDKDVEKLEKEKEKEKEKEVKEKDRDEAKEKLKQEKKATKKLMKEFAICKIILEEMEVHEDSWPFLLPVNTKQFPTYKKIIKYPMDLSTIKKRVQDIVYKTRDDFVSDVRQIFDNCEVFNEDDSPVGKAGHGMRKYFELRWAELTDKHS